MAQARWRGLPGRTNLSTRIERGSSTTHLHDVMFEITMQIARGAIQANVRCGLKLYHIELSSETGLPKTEYIELYIFLHIANQIQFKMSEPVTSTTCDSGTSTFSIDNQCDEFTPGRYLTQRAKLQAAMCPPNRRMGMWRMERVRRGRKVTGEGAIAPSSQRH